MTGIKALILIWFIVVSAPVGIWLYKYLKTRLRFCKCKHTRHFIPFTAGRLNDSNGNFRACAFGVRMLPSDPLPKTGEIIKVNTGLKYEAFTVKGCETLTILDPPKTVRSPEVYILVNDYLSDETILTVKERFGFSAKK